MKKSILYLKQAKQQEWSSIASCYRAVVLHHRKTVQRHFPELQHQVDLLPTDPHKVIAFFKSLRNLFRHHPQALQSCIHDLAIATFAAPHYTQALKSAIAWIALPKTTEALFSSARKETLRLLPHLSQIFSTTKFAFSAFLSTHIGTTLLKKLFPYDPKGHAWNAAGKLFHEKYTDASDNELHIDWTVGPTPTVGNTLAPEAQAVIQALKHHENDRLFHHKFWVYVNLQSLCSASERSRSQALMNSSLESLHHFRVASISVDAPWYRQGNAHSQNLQTHKTTLLSHLREDIMHPRWKEGKSWYAFAIKQEEQLPWWEHAQYVVGRAATIAASYHHAIPVFHELCVLGLIRAWQGFCLQHVEGQVMSTIACKECIDRGGSVNAAFVWAFSNTASLEKRTERVMAVLWGRPLLARRRLISECRSRNLAHLIEQMSPDTLRKYLDEIWQKTTTNRWKHHATHFDF